MKEHMDLGLPEKLEIHQHSNYMHISRKWFGLQVIFMTVFAIIWDVVLVNFYTDIGDEAGTLMRLFPLIHIAVGAGITYYAVAGWFNKSNIFVSKQSIEINHKPIPWFGNKKLKSTDLKQLYAKEKVSRNNNQTTVTYEVHAILNNDRNTKLLGGLVNNEQALYIEQEIEKYLGINDAKVKGEIG